MNAAELATKLRHEIECVQYDPHPSQTDRVVSYLALYVLRGLELLVAHERRLSALEDVHEGLPGIRDAPESA